MNYKPISTIKASDDAEPIEIRVIKKWIPRNQTVNLCYLFVDKERDAIHVVCLLADEAYFDSVITVGKCYVVDNYIPMPQHHMPACPHQASLHIGKKATFTNVENDQIPHHYYHFATYSDLPTRAESRMLTGYYKTGPTIRYLCRDDDGKPKFQYCVNATIKDDTGEHKVVFFDEAMTAMLGINCEDMITIHGEDNPYQTPKKILETGKHPKIMSLTKKDEKTTAVNKVTDDDKRKATTSTATTPALPPAPKTSQSSVKPPATPAKRKAKEA